MKLAVIGSGGREHAILQKLRENPELTELYAIPGNAGMKSVATIVPEISATDLAAVCRFCRESAVDYVVVAPDDPLVMGMVDALSEIGIPAFGPRKNAAVIEGSKVFSKNLCKKYGIPTAAYEVFTDAAAALRYVENCRIPVVLKADGLALGKGVIPAFSREEAREAVLTIMEDRKFGDAGNRLVIEEFLEGIEVSVLSFTDGTHILPMLSSMDHKRAGDGDTGLNTGGMGTIAPHPAYTKEIAARCMQEIFLPTLRAMQAEGRPFEGCLYFGLMLTKEGPKVIEYNCRFGDPEAQVVLPLLKSDLYSVMRACTEHRLGEQELQWNPGSACCVILASGGYPEHYEKGFPILGTEKVQHVDFAGVSEKDGQLVTDGGRVLGVVAVGETLESAIHHAYREADKIHFERCHMRRDIGQRALQAEKEM